MPVSTAQKRADFRKLHESGCFVLPNPWDVGSALLLQGMGFKALASTSSGMAWSIGHSDNNVNRDHVLAHLKTLCDATDLPVNADFEAGFAHDPAGVAANVARGVDTGVAGLSIEDSTGDVSAPLYEMTLAVERMRAARAAIDAKGGDVVLVGRCESFLVGQPDLKATIARLVAYAEAGADCLYAPGIRTKEQIAAVVKELAPKPINVLMGGPGLTVAELTDLGVRRISIGGALARAAWGGFLRAAREIAEKGSFSELAHAVTHGEINGFFIKVAKDRK
ncbi:isocitrate lyase/PEP mutase family protein [Afipia sp. DC4300-2b1]|uniref:isocitrate lyase/PEP mutase family protein n=1 Tax=Afipia sp. DC4300-2b1 TaxID=2804672 RepID=UPI003CECCCF4